jgi:hypothetical protein
MALLHQLGGGMPNGIKADIADAVSKAVQASQALEHAGAAEARPGVLLKCVISSGFVDGFFGHALRAQAELQSAEEAISAAEALLRHLKKAPGEAAPPSKKRRSGGAPAAAAAAPPA